MELLLVLNDCEVKNLDEHQFAPPVLGKPGWLAEYRRKDLCPKKIVRERYLVLCRRTAAVLHSFSWD
jgi:hypothetical protein